MPRETLLKLLEGFNSTSTTTTTTHNNNNSNETKTTSTPNTTLAVPLSLNNTVRPQIANSNGLFSNQAAAQPRIGIGLDSCVMPLRHAGLSLIQTTDFFYPLIEDVIYKINILHKLKKETKFRRIRGKKLNQVYN